MRHIREVDPQHTVIMVQVENETGSYGSPARFLARRRSRLFAAADPGRARAACRQERHLDAGIRQDSGPGVQRLVRRALCRRDRGGRTGGARPADVRQCGAQRPVHARGRAAWRERRPELERDRHLESRRRRTSRIAAPDIYDSRLRKVYAHTARPITRGPTTPCSFRKRATTCRSRASSGWRSARARSAGRRSAWTRPAISISRSARSSSTRRRFDAFASKFALLAPIARDWARLAFEHPTAGFAKPRGRVRPVGGAGPLENHRDVRPVAVRRARLDLDRRSRLTPRRTCRSAAPRSSSSGPTSSSSPDRTSAFGFALDRAAAGRKRPVPRRRGRHVRQRPLGDAAPLERRPDRLRPEPDAPTLLKVRHGDLSMKTAAVVRAACWRRQLGGDRRRQLPSAPTRVSSSLRRKARSAVRLEVYGDGIIRVTVGARRRCRACARA